MDEIRGYHGSRMYAPMTLASSNTSGSAVAVKPVMTHVWAPAR